VCVRACVYIFVARERAPVCMNLCVCMSVFVCLRVYVYAYVWCGVRLCVWCVYIYECVCVCVRAQRSCESMSFLNACVQACSMPT